MKLTLPALMVLAMTVETPALAAPSCLSADAYAADAALRYAAVLRETALACGALAQDEPIMKDYQLFIMNNAKYISAAQATLDQSYEDGADASHLRETEMQNDIASILARDGTARFCKATIPALKDAVLDSPREVQAAVDDFAMRHPDATRRCP